MTSEQLSLSEVAAVYHDSSDRDFSQFSDHITVWVDKHIGDKDFHAELKNKFNSNVQVLQSNNPYENEVDDETLLCADQEMLKKLSDECYCLKYFSTIDKALEFIKANSRKKIFFISSGTIGKDIVPQIADLPQIQGIYIFCGNISAHTSWAGDYVENISAMLEHQDNLLQRLTRDIAMYLEGKGDQYQEQKETMKARNCYAWAKKLLVRGQALGDTGVTKLIQRLTEKIEQTLSSVTCEDE